MSTQKTLPTGTPVAEFLAGIADERKRADGARLIDLMEAVTGEKPALWRGGIVGFGTYHYTYESGHEGDAPLVGFAPRARALTLYLGYDLSQFPEELARLGKHKTGKGCLYITRLSDIDEAVLRDVIAAAVADIRRRYP